MEEKEKCIKQGEEQMNNLNFKPNISVIDHGKKESPIIKRFITKEEAEDFIEDHDRPHDLDCKFDKNYLKRIWGGK